MRLIDADEVKQDIYKYIKEEGSLINPYRMLDYIDSAKTSKNAIPIEWIREYICDLEVVISSMRKSPFPNEQAIYNQQFRVFQIKSLLEDWEKENEAN